LAQVARGPLERLQHPRRDVGGHSLADHTGAEQVQREVAGARADLERPGGMVRLPPKRLAQLAGDLRLPDGVVLDSPLRVVAWGGEVVVAQVGVANLAVGP